MLEATIKKGQLLKRIVDAINQLVTDCNIDCDEDGMAIQAMDSSHVSLVNLTMKQSCFSHYRCDESKTLGMSLTNLTKILKCAGDDDNIVLTASDTETLNLVFETPSADRVSDFSMKLMDIDSENLGIPDTEYKCTMQIPSAEFQRICRDLSVLGDTCVISCTKEGVTFSVSGDMGSGNVTLRQNKSVDNDDAEDSQVIIQMEEPVELTFALRYLNFFTKATPLSKSVSISMSPDVPLVAEYSFGQDIGSVRFYLAPKIDEETEP